MDALEAILTRRSTRKMKPDPLPRDLIERVVESGRAAPSGGNNQTTHLLVIENRAVLGELADIVEKAFAAMEVTEGMYRSLKGSILASKKGGYVFPLWRAGAHHHGQQDRLRQRHGRQRVRAGEHDDRRQRAEHRQLLDQPAALAHRQ